MKTKKRKTKIEAKSEVINKLANATMSGGLIVSLLGYAFDEKRLPHTDLAESNQTKIINKL